MASIFEQVWRWVWNTETKYYDGEITRDTDWGGDASTENQPVSGGRVQEWLKNEINGKYGVIRMSATINEQNFYSLEMFATKADEDLYDNDPDTYAGLLTRVTIPISTVQGDSYGALLSTSIPMNDIVVVDGKLGVPLNFRAIRYSQGQGINEGARGTLTIQRSTDEGKSWNEVARLENVLTSREPSDSTTMEEVDLGEYLAQGKQLIRVRASYDYEDIVSGDDRVANSSWVMVGASVTRTKLSLELRTNYETPMDAKDVNGNANPFSVMYNVNGSVQKTLYVKIKGSAGEQTMNYPLGANVDSTNYTISVPENASYGYMTHGVKRVEAWLECQNGLGNTLKSDVLVNRFMVVNTESATYVEGKAYLLLQNVATKIGNFVQTKIAEYAVYNPSGELVNVAFLLTEYAEDYETSGAKEYFRLETQVTPNIANKLETTIEIENEDEGTEIAKYDTYFRVRRVTDTTNTDFMQESTGERNYYVEVDNKDAMTPVSGATFLLNPKTRSNNEEHPDRIYNAKNNNAEVESVWENFGFINDGWMTDDKGEKVLRVMAGSRLTIKKNVWAQYLRNPNSSLTITLDCKVSNVTNTTEPIVKMWDGTRGLLMNALEGWLMSASNQDKNNTLFAWDEDARTRFAVNLNHQVMPNKGDVEYTEANADKANGTIPLARVMINGNVEREMVFKTDNTTEWCATEDGDIVIGNVGADIDIYSIYIYENKQLEMTELLNRNYLASLPSAEDKQKVKAANDLLDGGRISLEKTKNRGLNCYVWHSKKFPYHGEQATQRGWLELFRYDQDGNYMPEYSGTICKETESLEVDGQGSTAMTYYHWNPQDKFSKNAPHIQVAIADLHASISVRIDGDTAYLKGGNLGKNYPLNETEVGYPYANGMVTVPDGWVDGNGKYRGLGYMVAPDTALAQKRNAKINYASSMQSHLIGACNTYDLLHRKVVGDTPLQERIPSAVSAKRTEPFMMFLDDGTNTYFKGMGTYGAAKADKVAWGFVKSEMPMYALIEGSDNNLPMTGFRVPFDKNTAVYSPDGEGWLYNGEQSFDFDLGNTTDASGLGYTTDGTKNGDGEVEMPTDLITQRWADIHNFIYFHSTNLKYFNGTFEQFKQSDKASDTNYKYWFTQGDMELRLKRYDFIQKEWVNAGLLEGVDYYSTVKLNTMQPTNKAYNEWVNGGTGDYALLNEMFKDAYAAQMKKYLKYFINEKSLQFNYCYVLGFLAGTDNSDKNTYYKIMPYAEKMEVDSSFATWFATWFGRDFDFDNVYQLYFDGDDMDSIFRTNNNSHQTKPYYIDRLHPYADGSSVSLYEGMGNQLFNFVERAYEGTHELAGVMKEIMNAMTELVGEDDRLLGLESGKKSVWGFLHKYFFNIQHYFPQIAYMEQARIRYEFPELLGFISSGGGARSIRPITQSLGSQLQNELQYMKQRVIYMTSYAGFGAWSGDTAHAIGLGDDANATFSFTPAALPDGSGATYTFTIKPHQYIYPSYFVGQTFKQTHQRTAPSGTCTFTIAENVTTSDSGMGICGINYISDLGDFCDKSITGNLVINGKRLTTLQTSSSSKKAFRPNTITIEANLISNVRLFPYQSMQTLDFSGLIRCKDIYVSAIPIEECLIPQSSNLTGVSLYARNITIKNCPNLSRLTPISSEQVKKLVVLENVGTNVGLNIQDRVETIYDAQHKKTNPYLQSIHVENVNWVDFGADVLDWYCGIPTCEFKGTISIKETDASRPAITWDLKNRINAKFGVVDTTNNAGYKGLLLKYAVKPFDAARAKIKGNFYVESGNTFQFEVRPYSIYENNQYVVNYLLNSSNLNASININTGVLTVNVLPEVETKAIIRARVWVIGNVLGGEITKEIEIWNRPAQVGDLVYHDGTFSSARTYDGEKSVVGMCCYVAPRKANGEINEKFHNPSDVMTRLMMAVDDVRAASDTEEFTSWQWGVFSIYANSEQATLQFSLYSDGANGKEDLTIDGVGIGDVPNLRNITSSGLKLENGTTTQYITDESLRDESDLGLENDGFKPIEANTAAGDGFAYNENATYLNERKLTDANGMKLFAGEHYRQMSGDVVVNSGYAKTLRVIAHRDNILKTGLPQVGIKPEQFAVPSGADELGALAQLMTNLRNWAKSDDGLGDEYGERWSQLYYPAASACYAYEPKVEDGDVLAAKFKKHHWFLATQGMYARLWWYTYVYSGGVLSDKEDSPFKDAFNVGVCKKLPNNMAMHSVTEGTATVVFHMNIAIGSLTSGTKHPNYAVRPICAF